MANTVIQIKKSNVTSTPPDGSLTSGELAYSYISDKLFIGSFDGSTKYIIGGQYVANTAYSAFNKANDANIIASAAFDAANAASGGAVQAAFDKANSANINASDASFLTQGQVPSARLVGDYPFVTGVGTIATGTWNGTTITVPYGGTGKVTFANNGVMFGNGANSIRVTAAGTEGQILQATSLGTPVFAMLDGGSF